MEGTFNGSRFALKRSATPFAERRETTLDIDLDALQLPPYVAYLPSRPTVDLAGGTLTTRLKIAFVEAGPTERRLELRGDAHVDGLAIKRRDGTPLVAADRIAVVLDRIGVFDRRRASRRSRSMRRTSTSSGWPTARSRCAADLRCAARRRRPARRGDLRRPRRRERPWRFPSRSSRSSAESIALADETSGFRSTLVDVKLDATSLSTTPGEKAHVKLAFVSADRIASFSGEADVDPMAPAATGRFELAKFSLGLLFPYYKRGARRRRAEGLARPRRRASASIPAATSR